MDPARKKDDGQEKDKNTKYKIMRKSNLLSKKQKKHDRWADIHAAVFFDMQQIYLVEPKVTQPNPDQFVCLSVCLSAHLYEPAD